MLSGMDRRTILLSLCSLLGTAGPSALLGAAAVGRHTPYFHLLMLCGSISIIAAIVGIACLWLTAPKATFQVGGRVPSTTIKASGGGKVDIEDFISTADTFADVRDVQSLSARRGFHLPQKGKNADSK